MSETEIHRRRISYCVGKAVSGGSMRLFNRDIVDLHDRVRAGARIVVVSKGQSLRAA